MLPPTTDSTGLTDGNHGGMPEERQLPVLLAHQQPEPLALPTVGWPGMGPPMKPEILSAGPDPLSLWHAIRRRWASGVGVGLLLGALLAVLTAWLMPVNVPVSSLLQLRRHAPKVLDDRDRPIDVNEYGSYRRTQQALVKSEFVLQAALRERGIAKLPIIMREADPIRFLKEEIVVSSPADSELMQIRMTGERSYQDQMVKIVNAVTKAYMTEYVEKDKSAQLRRREHLAQELNRQKKELDTTRVQFIKLAERLGTTDAQNYRVKERLLLQDIQSLRGEKSKLLAARFESQRALLMVKAMVERAKENVDTASQMEIQRALYQDPEYRKQKELAGRYQELILQESSVAKNGSSRTLTRFRTLLDNVQQTLDTRREDILPNILSDLKKDKKLDAGLKHAETELASFNRRIKEVSDLLDARELEAKTLTTQDANLDRKRSEIKGYEDMILLMSRQLATMKVEGPNKQRVVKLDTAHEPEAADMMMKYLLIVFAGIGGLGLGIVGIAYREFRVRRVSTTAQVSEGLGMRVVGTVPLLSGGKSNRKTPAMSGLLHGLVSESMDSIRTALVHSNGTPAPRMVMVTSATQREGKTTVASQLAASVARSGRRTLLVDADLRQPMANQLFEMPLGPGMCEVLRGEAELDDVVRPTRSPGLWMLSAGQCDLNSLHELARDGLEELFEKLRGEFDFIVVDTGPVLNIADSLLIGQQADAAILSVLKDSSSLTDIHEASEQLESVGIKVIGVVVNGISPSRKHRAYTLRLKASA